MTKKLSNEYLEAIALLQNAILSFAKCDNYKVAGKLLDIFLECAKDDLNGISNFLAKAFINEYDKAKEFKHIKMLGKTKH